MTQAAARASIEGSNWAEQAELPTPARKGAGGPPRVLTALSEAIGGYVTDPSVLPSLNLANGSERQQRAERRVACIRLVRACIQYLDLASLRIGIPQVDGEFRHLTVDFLAQRAGLQMRRAERAMQDLQRAGLVQLKCRCELREDGQYRGLAALKFIPAALFSAFRLGKWLRREREKARLRQQRRQAAHARANRTEQQNARGSLVVAGLLDKVRRQPATRSVATEPTHRATHDTERDKQLQLYATSLYARHPDRGRDWAYAQARLDLAEQGELV